MIWLLSSFHCTNIFSTDYNYAGVGGVGDKWTQVFTYLSAVVNNPLYDGAHWLDATRTGGQLRLLASFSSSSGAPLAINVTVGSTVYPMTRHLGTAENGIYSVDVPSSVASAECVPYFFQATTATGVDWRLPEGEGRYLTTELDGCTSNFRAPAPPTLAPTPLPTFHPTRPTSSPTSQPTGPTMVRLCLGANYKIHGWCATEMILSAMQPLPCRTRCRGMHSVISCNV